MPRATSTSTPSPCGSDDEADRARGGRAGAGERPARVRRRGRPRPPRVGARRPGRRLGRRRVGVRRPRRLAGLSDRARPARRPLPDRRPRPSSASAARSGPTATPGTGSAARSSCVRTPVGDVTKIDSDEVARTRSERRSRPARTGRCGRRCVEQRWLLARGARRPRDQDARRPPEGVPRRRGLHATWRARPTERCGWPTRGACGCCGSTATGTTTVPLEDGPDDLAARRGPAVSGSAAAWARDQVRHVDAAGNVTSVDPAR